MVLDRNLFFVCATPMCHCDIDQIRENALAQGIALSEITIIYKDLTEVERNQMRALGILASETEGSVLGKFMPNGDVLFKEKVHGVLHLGA